MSILVDKNTKVICQGFTGLATRAPAIPNRPPPRGTKMVGGTSPGKGGSNPSGPAGIRHRARSARETVGADASVIYVPPPFAADAILEAIDARKCR